MPENPQGSAGGLALGDYLHVLWRWKWMIIIVVVAATVGAFAYSWRQAPQYQSTATLLYVEPVDPTNPLGSSYYSSQTQDVAVESVVNVVGSSEVSDRVKKYLEQGVKAPYDVSTTVRGGTVSGTGGVIDVTATSGSPRGSAAVATAYAEAIVEWRKAQQLDRVDSASEAVKASLASYTTEASHKTAEYLALTQQLADLKLLETTAAGDFKLISPGAVPDAPVSPKPRQAAILGMGVGLLIAIGLAFLLDPLTTRVRGRREAGEVLGLPVIGSLPEIDRSRLKEGRLVALTDPGGPTAEALRLLRSNLDYMNVEHASSLMVTSALAGEGKSTTICNLAITMALAGKRVVLVDGDLRRPRVHDYFGLQNAVGLSSVAIGDVPLKEALVRVNLSPVRRPGGNGSGGLGAVRAAGARKPVVHVTSPGHPGPKVAERATAERQLMVLPAGPWVPDPGEVVASQRFGDVIRTLQDEEADLVLVDSPALMEVGDAAAMAAQVDALVVIVDITKAHHATLLEMRDMLVHLPCTHLGVILVKTKSRASGATATTPTGRPSGRPVAG